MYILKQEKNLVKLYGVAFDINYTTKKIVFGLF